MTSNRVTLAELKAKSPKDLLSMAEELEIENASTMRKGDMMFSILKERAEDGAEISGDGVLGSASRWIWVFAVSRGKLFAGPG